MEFGTLDGRKDNARVLNRTGFSRLVAGLLLLAVPGVLSAQQQAPAASPAISAAPASDNVTAGEAIQQAKRMYGPPPPRRNCVKKPDRPGAKQDDEEIVVCGQEEQDSSQFRVKSSRELDPNSPDALRDGVPRAPDVAGDGIFKGKATMGKLCLMAGCPPPPAYMIDLKDLPDAPEGSDADLIAKGKKPG